MSALWSEDEVYLVAGRAYELAMQGQYADAAILFDGLAAAAPENSYVRCSLAALCTQLQQPETALAVLAGAPDSPRAAQLRVEALLELNRVDEAARELRRAGASMRLAVVERLALRLPPTGNSLATTYGMSR
jgi:thioredoxin-like negative regulator of GroEL